MIPVKWSEGDDIDSYARLINIKVSTVAAGLQPIDSYQLGTGASYSKMTTSRDSSGSYDSITLKFIVVA